MLQEPVDVNEAASLEDASERQQRGTRQLLLARGCFVVSGYAVSVLLARALGTTDFGIYGVVISQLLWLEMFTSAGVPGATSKLMADGRHEVDEVERSARMLLLGLSLLLLGVCWFLAPFVATLMRIPQGARLFRIAIIDLPFAALYGSYVGILTGHRRFGIVAAAQVVYSMTKLAWVIALIQLGFSVERAIIGSVLSTCVVCAVLAVRYPPRGFLPRRQIMREIAAIAAPMTLYLVSGNVLLNLDLWSLQSLWESGGEVVGQYVASVNLARILTAIPAAQAGVLFASVAWAVASRDTARARRHIQEATRFAVVIAAGACVILGIDATEILSVLYSSAYAEGGRFLRLQLAGLALFALIDAFSHALMAAGRQWLMAGALITTVPLVWLSNYLLIPRLGPWGAAVSMLFGMGVGATLTGAIAYRHFGPLISRSTLIRVPVAATLVGLGSAAVVVRGPMVIFKAAVLAGLYLLMLHRLGEITEKDFRLGRKSPAKGHT
jgi:O-antigen/teichoic acid export membrane protein